MRREKYGSSKSMLELKKMKFNEKLAQSCYFLKSCVIPQGILKAAASCFRIGSPKRKSVL